MLIRLLLLSFLLTISIPAYSSSDKKPPALVLPDILQPEHAKNKTTPMPFTRTGPTIQVAILLDASGSMGGLINQAREQIWLIINAIATANKHDHPVTLQVALFEYGVEHQSKHDGYLRLLSPLTSDLDQFSEALFAIKIGGSKEYAPQVIQEATNRLQWSKHPDDLRLIIIAGNEEFQQGDIPISHAIPLAVSNGIVVNTLYCGPHLKGRELQWATPALLGHGNYLNIDHKKKAPQIETPYDDDIIELGRQLNETYIGYGAKGSSKKNQQLAQDTNASSLSKSSSAERSIAKAGKQYKTQDWDLISLAQENLEQGLTYAKKDQQHYRGLNDQQIIGKLKRQIAQREKLQQQISALEQQRKTFIKQSKNTKKTQKDDLGNAIILTIQDQAKSKGFSFL
ncbi:MULTISPECIES: vWA domain-containing protein [unclassified Photobacterium]|uniref:vWA domain-containing protein n=1 Tax=unclassified Photobacterium TaxID=2628852 RepID=UPI001EDCC62D|nr:MULTISPECIES: vWA domain-containing protein [unclassified Photobacterium]MCG3864518.1 VWA domain-containing protein [Photobacterium sp. Ph6]MCG3876589.1 VWA domain-containing protein [Photobacterium sp. Ph5]